MNDSVLILSEWVRWRNNDFFLQLWNLHKNARACTQQTAPAQRIPLQWKWVIGCIRGFLKHKTFRLRQEIEPSPSVRRVSCLNSSLFPSDARRASTPCVFWQKNKLRFFTVSLQYHFKDCRGVLICKDTGVGAPNQPVHSLVYTQSLSCWRWSVVAASKWEVSKWSRAVISTNSSSAASPQGERHPDWDAENSRL